MVNTPKLGNENLILEKSININETQPIDNAPSVNSQASTDNKRIKQHEEPAETVPLSQRNAVIPNSAVQKSPQALYEEGIALLNTHFNRMKAYKLLLEASQKGSVEAKKFLGITDTNVEIRSNLVRPFQSDKQQSQLDINQSKLLKKLILILTELQKQNPLTYPTSMIDLIKKDLDEGHCEGLSVYFSQLSLLKDPQTDQDRSQEYYDLMQQILNWKGELQEWPQGMSWEKLSTLPPNEQKRIRFTYEVCEFLSLMRFYQQSLVEAEDFEKTTPNPNLTSSDLLEQAPPVYLNQQNNYTNLLGDQYQVHNGTGYKIFGSDFQQLIPELSYYLTPNNAAIVSIPTAKESNHAVSIIYREGHYFYFDSNLSSTEVNYDISHSAIPFESLDNLFQFLMQKFQDIFQDDPKEVTGTAQVTFINLKENVQSYLPFSLQIERGAIAQLHLLFQSHLTPEQRQFLETIIDKPKLSNLEIKELLKLPHEILAHYPRRNHTFFVSLKDLDLSQEEVNKLVNIFPADALSHLSPSLMFKIAKANELCEKTPLSQYTLRLYNLAATKGSIEACLRLRQLYEFGEKGAKKDLIQAKIYAKKGAKYEDPDSMHWMGAYLLKRAKHQKAFSYFQKASKLGHAEAKYQLAIMHLRGQVTEQDHKKALKLFKEAFSQDYLPAGEKLAMMIDEGLGTQKNPGLAARIRESINELKTEN